MPLQPVRSSILLPLETSEDVANLVAALRAVKDEPASSKRGDLARDLGDHLAYLAGTRPELFAPFRDEVLQLPREDREHVSARFATLAVLMAGASDASADHLARELEKTPADFHLPYLLASIGTAHALQCAADHARKHDKVDAYRRMGIQVGREGPAQPRFTVSRRAVFKRPLEPGERLEGCRHPVGLPVAEVLRRTSMVTWHYLTLALEDVPGLPPLATKRLPLVSPRENWGWTLFLEIDPQGGVTPTRVVDDHGKDLRPSLRRMNTLHLFPRKLAELWLAVTFEDDCVLDFDEGLRDREREGGDQAKLELRPYDAELTYCNGHILSTEGVVGTAGGPPIGIYPPPSCPTCARQMFHLLSVTHHVRDYGDGFRSLFACEDCGVAACQATSWN